MRRSLYLTVAVLFALCSTAWVQAQSILITVDEGGKGTLVNPTTGTFALPASLTADPGPGGLPSALTYNLQGPPNLVVGDVILLEPGGTGLRSDLLRFNAANATTGYPASLVFYSDNGDSGGDLADTGFPTSLYTNTVTLTEVGNEGDNGLFYTPTANQPGFISGASSPVSYHFVSDVPEPGSVAFMVGLGISGGVFTLRRRRSRQV